MKLIQTEKESTKMTVKENYFQVRSDAGHRTVHRNGYAQPGEDHLAVYHLLCAVVEHEIFEM